MIAEKDFAGRQVRGVRELQEDSYAFSEITDAAGSKRGLLVVVADGMGGHNAGERASEIALKSFIESFHTSDGQVAKRLKTALDAANYGIALELERDAKLEGMGTTLVAAAVTDAGVEWISVGDSPLYLWRSGALTRLNEDHSLRPVLREMAQTKGEPEHLVHASRNLLRAAVTGDEIALIDQSAKPLPLQSHDVIIAASDGIHTLNDQEIAAGCDRAEMTEARELAGRLLHHIAEAANPRQDNTTIAIVKPKSEDEGLVLPL